MKWQPFNSWQEFRCFRDPHNPLAQTAFPSEVIALTYTAVKMARTNSR